MMLMKDKGSDATATRLKLFGRPILRYAVNLTLLPPYFRYVLRCLRPFECATEDN